MVGDNMRAVCILSGGIDSVSTAAYLKSKGYDLYLLTFNYGQRASKEIEVAKMFASRLGKEHKVIDISFMNDLYGRSNVLTYNDVMPEGFEYSIVVPIRNVVLLTVACAWAFSIGAKLIAYGAHTSDEPYPDCRTGFAKELEIALNLAEEDGIKNGLRERVEIWSPAIVGWSKSNLIREGYNVFGKDIFKTWSCYLSKDKHCGRCESCNNRKRAFADAGIKDETDYLIK